jgi:hypothetical protein
MLLAALAFLPVSPVFSARPHAIVIDGDMSDWAGVPGRIDPSGDNSKPGTDVLEFKVTHDEHFFYYYTRHSGPIVSEDAGTGGQGRYYYLVYLDLDNDATTGFNPSTTDPDCYEPAEVGSDLEFEFERDWNDDMGKYLVQHFYGYGGRGDLAQNQMDILQGILRTGHADYEYKAQYKFVGPRIPEDVVFTDDIKSPHYTPGEDVFMEQSFSEDMTESETSVDFRVALKDPHGHPNLAIGKTISIAFACESSPWADCGDGVAPINNYTLEGPAPTVTPTPSPSPQPTPTMNPRSDIDQNGIVDANDLMLLLRDWERAGAP